MRVEGTRKQQLWKMNVLGVSVLLLLCLTSARSFSPTATTTISTVAGLATKRRLTRVAPVSFAASNAADKSGELPDISGMKLKEIREELGSYGISTKAFLEKPEFVEALTQARAQGKKPKRKPSKTDEASQSSKKSSPNSKKTDTRPREVRIKEVMEKAKSMGVGDLRTELKSRGISTKSFFEKTDFVKAYAEAIVDGVNAKSTSAREEEVYDPSYRDVSVQKLDRGTRNTIGSVIDIRSK